MTATYTENLTSSSPATTSGYDPRSSWRCARSSSSKPLGRGTGRTSVRHHHHRAAADPARAHPTGQPTAGTRDPTGIGPEPAAHLRRPVLHPTTTTLAVRPGDGRHRSHNGRPGTPTTSPICELLRLSPLTMTTPRKVQRDGIECHEGSGLLHHPGRACQKPAPAVTPGTWPRSVCITKVSSCAGRCHRNRPTSPSRPRPEAARNQRRRELRNKSPHARLARHARPPQSAAARDPAQRRATEDAGAGPTKVKALPRRLNLNPHMSR